MTKGKVVIVTLIVLGVLFAFGLGSSWLPKKGEDEGPGGYQSGWLKMMDNLLGRFSPSLDRGRLQPDTACNKQPDGGYKLTGNAACNIGIAENSEDDYQTATLLVSNAANILVPCPEQGAAATERGMLARIKVKPMVMAKPPVMAFPAGATLTVVYTPRGKTPQRPVCAGKDEVRLVALKEGGSLKLQCNNCSASRSVKVDFKK